MFKRNVFSNPDLEVNLEGVIKKEDVKEDVSLKGRAHEVLTYLSYAFSLENRDVEGSFPFYQFCPDPLIQNSRGEGKPIVMCTPSIVDIAFVKGDGNLSAVVEAKDCGEIRGKNVFSFFNQLDRYARDRDIERVLVFSHLEDYMIRVLEGVLDIYRKGGGREISYCTLEDLEYRIESRYREVYERIKNNVSVLKDNALKLYLEIIEYAIADFMINTREMEESIDKIKIGCKFDMRSHCVIYYRGRYSVEPRVVLKKN